MISRRTLFGEDAEVLSETNLQVLLLVAILPPLGSALLSPVIDSLIDPFGASAATIGLMISVYTAPSIVGIPVVGALGDRYGRKAVLVPSILLYGLAGTAIVLTTDFRVVLALRFLQGVGFGGINPVIITVLGDLYTGSREETSQGLTNAMTGLSGASFPLVSGVLVVVGWQYPFLLYLIALPIAVAVHFWLDEPVEAGSTRGDAGESYYRALGGLVGQPRVIALAVGRALPTGVWVGFITYNSIVVVRLLAGTPPEAGVMKAVGSIVLATGASQAGRVTARFDNRFVPLLGGNLALAGGFALFVLAPGIPLAVVGIAMLGGGYGLSMALYRSIITGLAPAALRGGLVSLTEAGSRVTATITPVAIGAVIAVASPALGFGPALQVAGVATGVIGGLGGVAFLSLAYLAPPVSRPSAGPPDD